MPDPVVEPTNASIHPKLDQLFASVEQPYNKSNVGLTVGQMNEIDNFVRQATDCKVPLNAVQSPFYHLLEKWWHRTHGKIVQGQIPNTDPTPPAGTIHADPITEVFKDKFGGPIIL